MHSYSLNCIVAVRDFPVACFCEPNDLESPELIRAFEKKKNLGNENWDLKDNAYIFHRIKGL